MKRWHLKPWAQKVVGFILSVCIVMMLGTSAIEGSEGCLVLVGLFFMGGLCAWVLNEYGDF